MASRQSAGVREPQAPEWMSLQRAALRFEVSVDTLRRRVAAGELPASRMGRRLIRVRVADLERVLRPIPTALLAYLGDADYVRVARLLEQDWQRAVNVVVPEELRALARRADL